MEMFLEPGRFPYNLSVCLRENKYRPDYDGRAYTPYIITNVILVFAQVFG